MDDLFFRRFTSTQSLYALMKNIFAINDPHLLCAISLYKVTLIEPIVMLFSMLTSIYGEENKVIDKRKRSSSMEDMKIGIMFYTCNEIKSGQQIF